MDSEEITSLLQQVVNELGKLRHAVEQVEHRVEDGDKAQVRLLQEIRDALIRNE